MDFSTLFSKYIEFFIKNFIKIFPYIEFVGNDFDGSISFYFYSINFVFICCFFFLFYLLYLDNRNHNYKNRFSFFYNHGYDYIGIFSLPTFYILIGAYYLAYESLLMDKLLANFIIFFYITSIIYIYMFFFSFYVSKWNCFIFSLPYKEFLILYLFVMHSIFILIMSNHLFTIYLSIELLSLCLYIFIVLNKNSSIRVESALKLFIYSVFSTGLFLLGLSFIYMIYGTLSITELKIIFNLESLVTVNYLNVDYLVLFAILLIFSIIFFKLAIFPFHFWLADIYQGAELIITAFFAIITKIPFIILLFKFQFFFNYYYSLIVLLIQILCIISIFYASLLGLIELKIKRLLAYSSIVNISYIVLGLSLNTLEGNSSAFLYLFIYIISNICIFSSFLFLRYYDYKKGNLTFFHFDNISDLATLAKVNKLLCFIIATIIFSMAGIPPFSGFFGKLHLFIALFTSGYFIIPLLLLVATLINAVYYLRLIRVIFFEKTLSINLSFFRPYDLNSFHLSFLISITFIFNVFFIFFYPFILPLIF